jgi:serine/threonine-protein kinase
MGCCRSKYQILSKVGTSGSGVTYLALLDSSGLDLIVDRTHTIPSMVALKHIKSEAIFENEIRMLKILSKRSGIKYYGVLRDGAHKFIVMTMINGCDLHNYIVQGSLSTRDRYVILYNLAMAIIELHSAGFVHRDIKPENVMVSKNQTVTIVDYGLSYNSSVPINEKLWYSGTLPYRDPNCITGNFQSMRLGDWWAFGQTVVLLLCGKRLYNYENNSYNTLTLVDAGNIIAPFRGVIVRLTSTFKQEGRPTYRDIIHSLKQIVGAHG